MYLVNALNHNGHPVTKIQVLSSGFRSGHEVICSLSEEVGLLTNGIPCLGESWPYQDNLCFHHNFGFNLTLLKPIVYVYYNLGCCLFHNIKLV